ncbi:MAG: FIG01964566: Predicted membrane protein, hemolysin III homolog, partial [uncultured Corynebacteriales bacterium]
EHRGDTCLGRGPAPAARPPAPVRLRGLGGGRRRAGVRGRRHPGLGGRLRHRRVRADRVPAVRHLGDVPPGEVVQRGPARAAGPAGPLDDLRVHRRHLHPAGAAGDARADRPAGADRGLVRRARRRAAEDLVDQCPALAVGAALPGPGLGRRVHHAGPAGARRGGRVRADPHRRPALHRRRDRLRPQAAGPVADRVRLPRGLPPVHRDRGGLPHGRGLAGRLL